MLSKILKNKGLSVYECAQKSGVPYTTLLELVKGKTKIENCTALTVYKLSLTLHIPMEDLIDHYDSEQFGIFVSNVKHHLKEVGDKQFIIDIYEENIIRRLWEACKYTRAFYLLAAVDYLSRINDLPLSKEYNDIRERKLSEPFLYDDLLLMKKIDPEHFDIGKELAKSIPEFRNFNIIEGDLRNVA